MSTTPADDDDRTAPDPPAEEREPERTEQGAMKEIEDRERRGRKEGVRRDEGPLRGAIFHDLGLRTEHPARAGDVDPRIVADVADSVRPQAIRGDDDQRIARSFARQKHLPRQSSPAPRGGEQHPAGCVLEVAAEEPHDGALQGPNGTREEVEPRGERLGWLTAQRAHVLARPHASHRAWLGASVRRIRWR